ncbi:hypothetical protein MLD38_002061 [Melastoma candidum]|uniref:Uncharacterized protein n=1 Tax=Melastoma candidum TaxID=119954 RepID=A0ACB9SH86_9MYRT|nr:hypothetical protein MLD38_002061 [Melastoma candidum]
MQGQRSRSSSLVVAFDFDDGSSPRNVSLDQPISWNDVQNPGESPGVDLSQPPSNNIPFIRQDIRYLPGSSAMHDTINDGAHKTQHLPALPANGFAVSGILQHDQVHGPANFVPLSINGSSSSSLTQNLNSPIGFVGRGSESSLLIECPNLYMPSKPDALMVASSNRDGMQDNEASSGFHFDGRQVPCKRKALEGHVGQFSEAGGSTYLQNVEHGTFPNNHPASDASLNSAFSSVTDQRDRVNGASASDITDQTGPNNLQRNYHIRITSVDQGAIDPSAAYSITNPIIQCPSSSQQQLTVPTVNRSLDTRSTFPDGNDSNQDRHAILPMPAIPQSGPSVRWSRGVISRRGGSQNAVFPQTREAASNDEASSSRGRRRAREDPLFLPPWDMGIFVPNPLNGGLPAGDSTLPRNDPSSSRNGSSSGVNHCSNAHWDPHNNCFTQYPHRWSEYVRRSLMSSIDPEPDGQTSNSLHPAASSHEMMLPSRPSFPGHSFPSRSSMCNLTVAAEGRRRLRLASESVVFGMADMHDQHRDMRLDVDNMSYEELLALEERIGNVSTGLSEETILAQLKRCPHTASTTGSTHEIEPCCICQEEYNSEDELGALECGHDFHRDCIKQWLMHKNSCPICKATGLSP